MALECPVNGCKPLDLLASSDKHLITETLKKFNAYIKATDLANVQVGAVENDQFVSKCGPTEEIPSGEETGEAACLVVKDCDFSAAPDPVEIYIKYQTITELKSVEYQLVDTTPPPPSCDPDPAQYTSTTVFGSDNKAVIAVDFSSSLCNVHTFNLMLLATKGEPKVPMLINANFDFPDRVSCEASAPAQGTADTCYVFHKCTLTTPAEGQPLLHLAIEEATPNAVAADKTVHYTLDLCPDQNEGDGVMLPVKLEFFNSKKNCQRRKNAQKTEMTFYNNKCVENAIFPLPGAYTLQKTRYTDAFYLSLYKQGMAACQSGAGYPDAGKVLLLNSCSMLTEASFVYLSSASNLQPTFIVLFFVLLLGFKRI